MSKPGRNKLTFSSSPTRIRNDETLATLVVGNESTEPKPKPDILVVENDQKVQQNAIASGNTWEQQSRETPVTPAVDSIDSLASTALESDTALASSYAAQKKQEEEEEKKAAKLRLETNLKNIRHMNVLFWIIIFFNMSLIFPYGMIIWRVSKSGNGTYALQQTWDFLVPSIGVEVALALMVFPYFAWVRLSDIKSTNKKFSLHLLLGGHITHFVVILTAVVIITRFRITGVKLEFEMDLNKSIGSGNRSTEEHSTLVNVLKRTQEFRKCCGIENYTSWDRLYHTKEYPRSCCENGMIHDRVCSKAEVEKESRPGCLSIEKNAILCLCGTFITSVVLSAILTVLMVLQLIKIERYIRTNWSGSSEASLTALSHRKSRHSKSSKPSLKSGKSDPSVFQPVNERDQQQGFQT